MTTEVARDSATDEARINPLAIVSIVCAAAALAATVVFGEVVTAVFGVGAGHLALQQLKAREERGAALAYVALGVCYLLAVGAILTSAYYEIMLVIR